MKDHHQYAPVLRLKASELDAVGKLYPDVKKRITPLIEIIPKTDEEKPFAEYIATRLKNLAAACEGIPVYIDFAHIQSNPAELNTALKALEGMFASKTINYIPVVTLRTPKAIGAHFLRLTQSGRDIAIRIKSTEALSANFAKAYLDLLSANKAEITKLHLILDCELVDGQPPDIKAIANNLPNLSPYARFILLSGSFPKDLTGFKLGISQCPRNDWGLWKQARISKAFSRTPIFGDYAIQHPIYSAPPAAANVSASIRYTAEDYWLILRGESLRNANGPKHKQYAAHTLLLVSRPEFTGESFCAGDNHINSTAVERRTTGTVKKTGNPKTWLAVGFNHHLSFVINQLAKIP